DRHAVRPPVDRHQIVWVPCMTKTERVSHFMGKRRGPSLFWKSAHILIGKEDGGLDLRRLEEPPDYFHETCVFHHPRGNREAIQVVEVSFEETLDLDESW